MSSNALKLIHPVSKRDQVVSSFKEAILRGDIQPGEAIVESRVAQQLGAGIPLVREALIELEHQGYVQKIPYKGTTVTRLDRSNVKQIFRLRVELETLAMEWAKESVTSEDIKYLRRVTLAMKEAAQVLDLNRFYEADLAFHRKIWEMTGNEYLIECLERIVVPLFAFFVMKNRRERKSYITSAINHEKIVDALSKRSKAQVRRIMRDSLAGWKTEVLDKLLPEDQV
jgi:DNA-binding GntR family transcriptional regulator